MEWIAAMQEAISYMEDHLLEEINYEDVARHVHTSSYEFHRTFSCLTGMTANAYIRNRRLSLAGMDLLDSDVRITDIALKYGYETPEAFTKAFTRFHGVSPKAAREDAAKLTLFNPLTIKITVDGGKSMDYRIVQTEQKKFIALTRSFSNEIINDSDNHEIPDFWGEVNENQMLAPVWMLREDGKRDLYGLCSQNKAGSDSFEYGIGIIVDKDTAEFDLEELGKRVLSSGPSIPRPMSCSTASEQTLTASVTCGPSSSRSSCPRRVMRRQTRLTMSSIMRKAPKACSANSGYPLRRADVPGIPLMRDSFGFDEICRNENDILLTDINGIEGYDMQLITDYMRDEKSRHMLNELTQKVFGFDFEGWVTGGGFEGDYIPFSLVENGKMISNVSANRMKFMQNGTVNNYIQIGTVMTDESHRKQGLAAKLMNHVIEEYEKTCDGFYLFGALSAEEFYKKMGFCITNQYRYFVKDEFCCLEKAQTRFMPIKDADEAMKQRYISLVRNGKMHSSFEQINKYGLQMFYTGLLDNVFYADDIDCFVVLDEDDCTVLQSVLSDEKVALTDVLRRLDLTNGRCRLGYTPLAEDMDLCTSEFYDGADDYRLFYRGKELESIERDRLYFPDLSHA